MPNIFDFSRTIPEGTELTRCELIESVSTGNRSTRPTTNIGVEVPSRVRDLVERSSVNVGVDQQEKIHSLLTEFADVFSSGPQDLGSSSKVKHKIDTGDARPIRQPAARRLPFSKME